MANNELAYKIVVDTSKAAEEIRALEAEITRLKNELLGVSEGTVAFDTISQAVDGLETRLEGVITEAQKTGDVIVTESQQASSALNNVSQSANNAGTAIQNAGKKTKEVNFEQAFKAFVKVGSAVTSSFAAAQAAIGLFGGDSTKVAEAAAKAQNALTLAIAAREIAEGLGSITTIRATIVQKAKNAADTASIGILKRLFAVIAANPYTALAIAIGAVVAAIYALVTAETEEEKQAKKTAEALKGLNDEREKAITTNQQLIRRINNLGSELNAGRITVEEFTNGLKSFISNIDDLYKYLNEADLNKFLNNQTNILLLQDEIAANQKILNSDELKNDRVAQKVIENEIQRLDVQIAKRQTANNKILAQIEEKKKAETKAAEELKKDEEAQLQALLEEIKLRSELVILENEQFEAKQKLGDIDVEFATQNQLDLLKELAKSTEDYLTVVQKLNRLTADYAEEDSKRIQDAENQITNFGAKIKNLDTLLGDAFGKAKVQVKGSDLRKLIQEQFKIETGELVDLKKQVENAGALLKFQQNFIQQYTDARIKSSQNTGEALRAEQEAYRNEAKALFDVLVENEKGLVSYQDKVTKLKEELAKLTKETDSLKKSQQVLTGFLKENADAITKQYTIDPSKIKSNREKLTQLQTEFDQKTFDKQKVFQSDITTLETELLEKGLDIRNASYEVKLELLKGFVDKEVQVVEKGEKDKEEKELTRIQKIQEGIQQFQSVLNSLQQATTLFYEGQLNELEKRNKRIQDNIIGESEAANKKRLEADKLYNKEKERIEKAAAKTSLRISLAQSLANTAEAITKTTAELGPIGLVAAGAIIALNAAQSAIILNQLSNIDSYRSGGRIKQKMGTGGFVTGPSHEQGGVKFQGGGIELEGNESVINRVSTINYMSLLSQINQAGGGRPIGPGFDDSRIVEAIAKQRNTPIRAYVVESDITSKQETARRLDKLSQI